MNYFLKQFSFYAIIVISVGICIFCGYLTYVQSTEYSTGNIIYYIVGVIICWYMSLQMHECGHKLFGVFAGMDVRIKPYKIFSTSLGCEIAPKYDGSIKKRFLLTTSGGLIVNLCLLVVGIVFTFLPITALGDKFYGIEVILRAFFPTSFYIFFINILPFRYKSGRTDGLAMLEAIRGDDAFKVAEVILSVQGQINSGLTFKDLDEQQLRNVPQIQEDDAYFVILTELRYEYYKAVGKEKKAEFFWRRYESIKKYL